MQRLILFILSFAMISPLFGQVKRMPSSVHQGNPLDPESVAPPLKITPDVPVAPFAFPALQQKHGPISHLPKPIANHLPLKAHISPTTGTPYLIEGELKTDGRKSIEQQVWDYLKAIQPGTGMKLPAEEFNIRSIETDEYGLSHIRLSQVWKGVPVFGAEAILHKNEDAFYLFNGRFFPTPALTDLTPALSAEAAAGIARSHSSNFEVLKELAPQERHFVETQEAPLLVIYYLDQDPTQGYLAWQVTVMPNIAARYTYFVDAKTGEVLHYYSELCKLTAHLHSSEAENSPTCLGGAHVASVMGNGATPPPDGPYTANATDLHGQTRLINTYSKNNTYYLIDATQTMFNANQSIFPDKGVGVIWTINAQNTSPDNSDFQAFHVTSSNNTWNNPIAVSAHYNAKKAYEYYKSTFNRESINGQGGNIISFINVVEGSGAHMDNAFWNGAAMFYGNGSQTFSSPLAKALDVAGHEMTHGVIQSTADLVYMNESGALNESFADIFGAMIDRNNWKLGEDVVNPNVFVSGALRDLSNPHNGGASLNDPGWQPAHYSERYTGTQDNGGVHINSGIMNKAFYLFASNTNVGKDIAEQVYYRALSKYLVKSSQFIDCRIAVIQAATDLYGANPAVVNAAKSAFEAVGIGSGSGTNTQTDVDTNPGAEYILMTDDDYSKLYIFTPGGSAIANPLSTISPLRRPSITDDGSTIVYISNDNRMQAISINWNTSTVEQQTIQSDPIWYNVAISRDGKRLAALTTDNDNRIWVYNFDTNGPWKVFTLYNPTTAQGGNTTNDVVTSDVLEWDFSGEWVMYDAYNQLNTSFGGIDYWDIGFVNVWNSAANNSGNGFIIKLFSGLPENVSVGNPSFSKNSDYIITFDYIDEYNDEYYLLAANIETGDVSTIFQNDQLSWPNYSVNDKRMVFNASTTSGDEVLAFISIGNDKISPIGNASVYISYGRWGVWFANGKRVLTGTGDAAQALEQLSLYPNPAGNELSLDFSSEKAGEGQLLVLDLMGRVVLTQKLTVLTGKNQYDLSIENLHEGSYFVRLQLPDGQASLKFVKQ